MMKITGLSHLLSGRTFTIGGWLNTFLPHCKQHTYTHPLRSLDLPRLSPLSVFPFHSVFPDSYPCLVPLILCWLPRLGLFLHGLWYLPPALTTLPVSLTTSLLCPLCSYCWWLTCSCLTILIKLQMDPTLSDVSSKYACVLSLFIMYI